MSLPSDEPIETVVDARAIIGESLLWSPQEQRLYWSDIKGRTLHRLDPKTNVVETWPVSADLGAFALLPDLSGAVVALRSGISSLDFKTGALTPLAPPPYDPAVFRFNEGACDAAGRFWIGVMFDPEASERTPERNALHSFTLAGGLRTENDLSELHNGMAWSADSRTFYLSHSNSGLIHAHDYDVGSGTLGARRLFAAVPQAEGVPDGAAMDTDGGYWCACHGGGRLRRHNADGSVDRDILLPVSQPTMCAFGGEELGDLYVTSARDQLSHETLLSEPLAGGVFRLRPGEHGLPRRAVLA